MKLRVDFSMKICIVAAETRRWFLVKVERHKMAKAKTIVQITDPAEMAGFIKSNGTQCRFVGILTRTPVVDIRAKNPWGAGRKTRTGLFKVSRKIGIINANYVSSVSRRIAEKLGVGLESVEYVPGQVWYEHLKTIDGKNLPLVQHKDPEKRTGIYLQYFPHKSRSEYVSDSGEIVPEETVAPWLYAKPDRPDYKPSVISVSLANVMELKASGVVMRAEEFEEAEAALA